MLRLAALLLDGDVSGLRKEQTGEADRPAGLEPAGACPFAHWTPGWMPVTHLKWWGGPPMWGPRRGPVWEGGSSFGPRDLLLCSC